ncbi:sigma-70 family RNA polymerase sigma factor [Aquimarina gracilis]|uniref:Sigma-70 family RNA polymerase sigma factor n=1 Tax=Aquimarina gracilis TaxID=874422 RepID=A0ABU6A242_9FLAO|nr:sigma-70 family RNA polymerase sigma factor [Aquimarina gracilis]MEB3348138.1 sigma-70 family RNA polymerase sigma factor [Aquimarina gracilis]
MKSSDPHKPHQLTDHFFRNEYGKIVAVITRYVGTNNVETAEDIVQETLLKAVDHWQQQGIPENPQAWLYTAAKNHAINVLKRKKHKTHYESQQSHVHHHSALETLEISEALIKDEQLKMMFACCHPSISKNSQIALILKILCGFSISEIASAFFTSTETINKRLVRGRKQLRLAKISFEATTDFVQHLDIVLKTIYLLFNEGYSPSQQNKVIRYDLCLEAIRLAEILGNTKNITEKSEVHALLALMYFNAARFEARIEEGSLVEMHKQDRQKWNVTLMNAGIHYLNQTTNSKTVSVYQILATISGHHCIAPSFETTNWNEILSLYDSLIVLQDTPLVQLNRSVPLAKVKGNRVAIDFLKSLENTSDIGHHYLFHATLAEFYIQENLQKLTKEHLQKAISLCTNARDIELLEKKLNKSVPIS